MFKLRDYGMVRVAVSSPEIKVGGIDYNLSEIKKEIDRADKKNVDVILFPELSITAYTMGDLFFQQNVIKESYLAIENLMGYLKENSVEMLVTVGAVFMVDNQLFNCAFVIYQNELLGIVPKTHIPNYNEFYEKRWFSSSTMAKSDSVKFLERENIPFKRDLLFKDRNSELVVGVEICEDLWVPIPPSSNHSINGANVILNLSASNETVGKESYRRDLVKQQSGRCISAYAYSSSGIDESSTDLVFGGHMMIVENGKLLKEELFGLTEKESMIIQDIDVDKLQHERIKINSYMENSADLDYKVVEFSMADKSVEYIKRDDLHYNVFAGDELVEKEAKIKKIISIQTSALIKRLKHIGLKKVVIGISGGLDSTLAFLVCINTFKMMGLPLKNIVAVTMPGFGTTGRTYDNAVKLIKEFGAEFREISIKAACEQHFKDIGHNIDNHDLTYENSQARERTQILMDISSMVGGIVIGTGNLSELALGWCTYNADHMSMYAINCSIPKTLVKDIINFLKDSMDISKELKVALKDIVDTPISPELLPPTEDSEISQVTENIIGDYILHDFFLYYVLRFGFTPKKIFFMAKTAFDGIYEPKEIKDWLKLFYRRFFTNQFKRSCMPDGPKVGSVSLSPRGDWRMPSDSSYAIWMKEVEAIEL